MRYVGLTLITCFGLAGCTSVLPTGQPSASAVLLGSTSQVAAAVNPAGSTTDYAVVTIGSDTARIVNEGDVPAFLGGKGSLAKGSAADVSLGVGDTVSITVYEAAAQGGLFTAPGTAVGGFSSITVPSQTIDHSGKISIPYAGDIQAAGRSLRQVQQEIVDKLKNRAVEPQVIISVTERRSNLVTIIGDVSTPTRVAVDQGGLRVLDALAQAGGSKYPSYETSVTVTRGGRHGVRRMSQIMASPAENVFLKPGDTIEAERVQRFYNVIGATGKNGRVDFGSERVTLADAVANAGGLNDDKADAAAIFLYRQESRDHMARLGVDVHAYANSQIPVIYRLNIRDPGAIFNAQQFKVREGDFMLVSNAPTVDFLKFISVLRGATGVARDISGTIRDLTITNQTSGNGVSAIITD